MPQVLLSNLISISSIQQVLGMFPIDGIGTGTKLDNRGQGYSSIDLSSPQRSSSNISVCMDGFVTTCGHKKTIKLVLS